MSRIRLAILATHPIQYCAPLFRLLSASERCAVHVFYGWEGAVRGALDHGFGRMVQWDIPLLDGYQYRILHNNSDDPGTHHFNGINSRETIPQIRKWNPDALLVFGWNYRSHLAALREFHGSIPIFFRGDSTLLDDPSGPRRLLRRTWLRWVYRHVDAALYVGSHNKAYFLAHGLQESQLIWAPHSVDNDRFADPDPRLTAAVAEWRRGLGIGNDAVVIAFAGKLEAKKAPDILLDAFLRRRSSANEHLVFVGTGPLETVLRERARECQNIHFLGFQNQSRMPAVYRLADIFVLPSRGPGETWGLAVNECLASGRPVIVSDQVGCAPDLVMGAGSGLVVRAGSVESLTDALAQLSNDPAIRHRMSAAGLREIANWSLHEQARRLENAIEKHINSIRVAA